MMWAKSFGVTKNDVGYKAEEMHEGQVVKSYLGHTEDIELKSCEQVRANGNFFLIFF